MIINTNAAGQVRDFAGAGAVAKFSAGFSVRAIVPERADSGYHRLY